MKLFLLSATPQVLGCEQTFLCSEIRGEERKTSECTSVTACVTCERPSHSYHARTLATTYLFCIVLCIRPHGILSKRETARSLLLNPWLLLIEVIFPLSVYYFVVLFLILTFIRCWFSYVTWIVCFIHSLILDNERWKQADVPTELQSLVDSLVDGKNQVKFFSTLHSYLLSRTFLQNNLHWLFSTGVYPRGKEPKFSIGEYDSKWWFLSCKW